MMMEAKRALEAGGYACVIVRDGAVRSARRGVGVKPLLWTFDRWPGDMAGAAVADKVVGKAAAMLLALGGAREVCGRVMSRAAHDHLAAQGIPHRWDEMVPFIANRAQDGLCPIEQSVLSLDDPAEGLAAIRSTVARLMAGG